MGVLMSSTLNSLQSICERCLPFRSALRIAFLALYFSDAIVLLLVFVISDKFSRIRLEHWCKCRLI